MKNINWQIKSEGQEVKLLIRIVAFCWFLTKIWSFKTWIPNRLYPLIPIFDFFNYVPDFFHYLLFAISLIVLLVVSLIKRNRALLVLFFATELFSCLLDSVRWQPWEYMYLCICLIFIINYHKPKNIILLMHLFLVSIYLFSGLHKLNRNFLSSFWMNVILIDYFGFSTNTILNYKLFFAGLIIPFFEILFAVLLTFSHNKKRISYFLILIHLSILIVLGPFGLVYNSVVWFWNLALIFILLIIYNKSIKVEDFKSFSFNHFYWFILWFLMPILSFFGRWYQYLSFNLYSGKGNQMYICFSKNEKIQTEFGDVTNYKGVSYINLQNWAMQEIKSAPIPEMEIYLKISKEIKKKYGEGNVKVILYNSENKKRIEL